MKYMLKSKAVSVKDKKKVHLPEASLYKKNRYPIINKEAAKLGRINVVP